MNADEFSDWQQKTDETASAHAHSKRAYRLAMTALVVAISALAVSTIVLLVSSSTALSPERERPTAVFPPAATSPYPASEVMKKTERRAD
jgi:hypothetical protein